MASEQRNFSGPPPRYNNRGQQQQWQQQQGQGPQGQGWNRNTSGQYSNRNNQEDPNFNMDGNRGQNQGQNRNQRSNRGQGQNQSHSQGQWGQRRNDQQRGGQEDQQGNRDFDRGYQDGGQGGRGRGGRGNYGNQGRGGRGGNRGGYNNNQQQQQQQPQQQQQQPQQQQQQPQQQQSFMPTPMMQSSSTTSLNSNQSDTGRDNRDNRNRRGGSSNRPNRDGNQSTGDQKNQKYADNQSQDFQYGNQGRQRNQSGDQGNDGSYQRNDQGQQQRRNQGNHSGRKQNNIQDDEDTRPSPRNDRYDQRNNQGQQRRNQGRGNKGNRGRGRGGLRSRGSSRGNRGGLFISRGDGTNRDTAADSDDSIFSDFDTESWVSEATTVADINDLQDDLRGNFSFGNRGRGSDDDSEEEIVKTVNVESEKPKKKRERTRKKKEKKLSFNEDENDEDAVAGGDTDARMSEDKQVIDDLPDKFDEMIVGGQNLKTEKKNPPLKSDMQREGERPVESLPKEKVTPVDLATDVFKFIVKEFEGKGEPNDIRKESGLFPIDCDVARWFEASRKLFNTIERNGRIILVLAFMRDISYCLDYIKVAGCSKECTRFHVCKDMLCGNCFYGSERCKFSHDFLDEKNVEVASSLGLSKIFTSEEICTILRVRYPHICPIWMENGCCDDDIDCPFLHMCQKYILGKCLEGATCPLVHDKCSPHNKPIVDAFAMGQWQDDYFRRIIYMQRSGTAQPEAMEVDSEPRSPGVLECEPTTGPNRERTISSDDDVTKSGYQDGGQGGRGRGGRGNYGNQGRGGRGGNRGGYNNNQQQQQQQPQQQQQQPQQQQQQPQQQQSFMPTPMMQSSSTTSLNSNQSDTGRDNRDNRNRRGGSSNRPNRDGNQSTGDQKNQKYADNQSQDFQYGNQGRQRNQSGDQGNDGSYQRNDQGQQQRRNQGNHSGRKQNNIQDDEDTRPSPRNDRYDQRNNQGQQRRNQGRGNRGNRGRGRGGLRSRGSSRGNRGGLFISRGDGTNRDTAADSDDSIFSDFDTESWVSEATTVADINDLQDDLRGNFSFGNRGRGSDDDSEEEIVKTVNVESEKPKKKRERTRKKKEKKLSFNEDENDEDAVAGGDTDARMSEDKQVIDDLPDKFDEMIVGGQNLKTEKKNPPLKSDMRREEERPVESLPKEKVTPVDLATDVFKFIVKEFEGKGEPNDIRKESGLFPIDCDVARWFEASRKLFNTIERNGRIILVLAFMRDISYCLDYIKVAGCSKECTRFHVCKDMLCGNCFYGSERCKFSHDFLDEKNVEVASSLGLSKIFTSEEICTILRVRYPHICPIWMENGCCDDDIDCPFLHMCQKYILGKCLEGATCPLVHDKCSPHNKPIVDAFAMGQWQDDYFRRIIYMQRSGTAQPEAMEVDSEPRSPGVLECEPTTGPNRERTISSDDDVTKSDKASDQALCDRDLVGSCNSRGCRLIHSKQKMTYIWQVKQFGEWTTLSEQEAIERKFCENQDSYNVMETTKEGMTVTMCFTHVIHAMLTSECGKDSHHVEARRLSTSSYNAGKTKSEGFKTQWRWYFQNETSNWQLFEPDSFQHTLEAKFLAKQSNYHYSRENYRWKYTIDFNAMIQFNLDTRKKSTLLRRPIFINKDAVKAGIYPGSLQQPPTIETKLPKNWVPWDLAHPFELVKLSENHPSYVEVASNFYKTLSNKQIIDTIFRVQNHSLWSSFCNQEKTMIAHKVRNGSDTPVVKHNLYHGTYSLDAVRGISINNFDARVSGKNATMYGDGAYFARDSRYSHSYTDPPAGSKQTERFMFQALVLVGEYTSGNKSYRRPPPKLGKDHELYDSCVNDMNDPSIFILFEKNQYYPEFLIQYHNDSAGIVTEAPTPPVRVRKQAPVPPASVQNLGHVSNVDFDYPDFEETIMKPSVPSSGSLDALSSSGSSQSFSASENGSVPASGMMPSIDRSTKPTPDKSKKPNVTQIQVKSTKTDSLYPDVSTISKPSSTQNKSFTNADSRATAEDRGFTNAGSRAGVHSSALDQKSGLNSGANLTGFSNDIANDLKDFDMQKKRKEDELEQLNREYERIRRARLERTREEKKRVSDLEEMR